MNGSSTNTHNLSQPEIYLFLCSQIVGANDTHIIVTLHISNLTTTARVDNRITADDALQTIMDQTENGTLPFSVELSPGMRVRPLLFQVSSECPQCDVCHCDDDANPGAAFGIVLGILLFGLLLGVGGTLLTLFIIKKCRSARYKVKTGVVSYEKHEDEVVVN